MASCKTRSVSVSTIIDRQLQFYSCVDVIARKTAAETQMDALFEAAGSAAVGASQPASHAAETTEDRKKKKAKPNT